MKKLAIGTILSCAVLGQTANRNIVIGDGQRVSGDDNRVVASFRSGLMEDPDNQRYKVHYGDKFYRGDLKLVKEN